MRDEEVLWTASVASRPWLSERSARPRRSVRYSRRSRGEPERFRLLLLFDLPGESLWVLREEGEGEGVRLRPGERSFLESVFRRVGEWLLLWLCPWLWLCSLSWSFLLG